MAVMAWIPVLQDNLDCVDRWVPHLVPFPADGHISLMRARFFPGTAKYCWELHEQNKNRYGKLESGPVDDNDNEEEAGTEAGPPHSSSVDSAPGAAHRRETWPRNESGAYLPVATSTG